jgi:hypothetical protein
LKDHQALMDGQKDIHQAVQELQHHLRLEPRPRKV